MTTTLRSAFRTGSRALFAVGVLSLAGFPLQLEASPQAIPDADAPVVLVVYHSLTGNTQAMAEAAAEGAQEVSGVTVELMQVGDATAAEVERAAGIVVASPTHWANLPSAVVDFVNQWPFMGGKVAGAIATAGNPGGGSEHVLQSLIAAFLNHGAMIVGPIFEEDGFRFGTMGASALTGPVGPGVNEAELEGARRLGQRVARVVLDGTAGAR